MTTRNQYHKARTVLKSLIQGLDPETGTELPKDAIVNRIEVNRSMHVAVTAMEQVEARILRRAQLPESVGKRGLTRRNNSSRLSSRAPNRFRSSRRITSAPSDPLKRAWRDSDC
jgi:hypothetical protein